MQLAHRAAAAVARSQPKATEEHRGGGALDLPRGYLQHYGIGRDPPHTITVGGKVVLTGNPSDAELLDLEQLLGADFATTLRAAARQGAPAVVDALKPYLEPGQVDQPIVQELAAAYVRFVGKQDADAARANVEKQLAAYRHGTMPPEVIKQVRDDIEKLPAGERGGYYLALQEMSAYNSQRDTKLIGTRGKKSETKIDDANMCNLTVLAMILESLGHKNPGPHAQFEDSLEAIRIKRGLGERSDQGTLTALAQAEFGVSSKAVYWNRKLKRADWFDVRDKYLAAGKGVMLHVPLHYIRLQSVGDTGIVVDDPIGKEQIVNGVRSRTADNAVGSYDNQGEDNAWDWAIEKFEIVALVIFG